MDLKNLDKFVTEVLAIEAQEAKEAGTLGYMSRALVQATMPHKKIECNEFIRRNGNFVLVMLSPSIIGLPYGTIPRLLMAWITTEAVRTKSRTLYLNSSLSKFMQQLGIVPTGGKWGSIIRLKEQTRRLLSTSISCFYETETREIERGFRITDGYDLWWTPKDTEQTNLFDSFVTLSNPFFDEIINNPVPIDLRALKVISKSPLALDIYCWLTHRMSYLSKKTIIPWPALQVQFGSDYASTKQGIRDFKRAFLRELKKVNIIYNEVRVEINSSNLILKPSPTHIPKKINLS